MGMGGICNRIDGGRRAEWKICMISSSTIGIGRSRNSFSAWPRATCPGGFSGISLVVPGSGAVFELPEPRIRGDALPGA